MAARHSDAAGCRPTEGETMASEVKEFGVRFGAMSPPLADQLADYVDDSHKVERWQRAADAITRLHLNGFLTDAEVGRARRRLFNEIDKTIPDAEAPHA